MTYFETQALALFFHGLDTVEIAESLGISEAQAERHLNAGFDAMRRRRSRGGHL